MTLNVGIYLFDQVEVLDFAGPYEVFTTASRVALRREPMAPPHFHTFSVARVAGLVRARAGQARITASVCTGAFLLAKAGVLEGRTATTHWEDVADLRAQFPALAVRDDVRWVDEGSVVSSAGIAAGIDMSLHLVARLASPALAEATARQMDVPYRPHP